MVHLSLVTHLKCRNSFAVVRPESPVTDRKIEKQHVSEENVPEGHSHRSPKPTHSDDNTSSVPLPAVALHGPDSPATGHENEDQNVQEGHPSSELTRSDDSKSVVPLEARAAK